MKTSKALVLVTGSILISTSAFAKWTTSPSSVKIMVYSVAISPNTDCSNATVVNTFSGGKEFDFEENPNIMSGKMTNGTYPCVIMQMSDQLKVTPKTDSGDGVCVAGTEYTQSVCNSGNGQKYSPMTINTDNSVTFGTSVSCTGNEVVPLFLSTGSTAVSAPNANLNPFEQPVAANASRCVGSVATGCGINLGNAFTVSGSSVGTFIVNFNDKLDEQNNGVGGAASCSVEAPIFDFR